MGFAMAKLMDLEIGSEIVWEVGGTARGVLISKTRPHPRWPNMMLAVWYMRSGSFGRMEPWISFDALDPRQDVGQVVGIWRGEELFHVIYKIAWSPSVPGSSVPKIGG